MSIVDDLKTEAAKLLAEAESVEKKALASVFGEAKTEEVKVETDVKAEVAKAEVETKAVSTDVKAEVAAVETKTAAVVAVVKSPVAQFKGKKVCGVQYAADGLTIEWKEK